MAAINDLISQIQDETLRNRIQEEVSKMAKQKKFGLVFEEHMPESTPLYDMPIKRGCNVMRRDSKDDKSIYVVLRVEGDTAVCVKPEQKDEAVTFDLKDIVRVAEFGESIYPYLKPLDSVCNAPDSDLWHTLIEADNYHALQLLEYLYAGKVDCIYIDPPYNTGAKDWKYNNDYVDGNDAYRHSKWLSFMQRRLKLAKKLLNPADSVLIVTIDEKEYLHLGCLLEEMFPEAQIQMVSITINPSGAIRKNLFSRADEYAFFVILGDAHVVQKKGDGDEVEVRWWYLRRLEYGSRRGTVKGGIAQFYPIYIDNETHKIVKIGKALPHTQDRHSVPDIDGATTVFPIRDDSLLDELEMRWEDEQKLNGLSSVHSMGFRQFIFYLAHKVDFIAEIFLCTMILFGNVGAQPAASFLLKFASFAKFLKQPESLCCFCTNQIFNFFSCNTAVFQCILKNE